jgi:aspartate/methionine/tyrosine aminotransferase
MQFPARFADLPEYAFPRLRRLLADVRPGGPEFAMTIGEPRHPLPDMVGRIVAEHSGEFALYPPNDGTPEVRAAIAAWLSRRYGLSLDPDAQVVLLNGTREGLFNAALALSPEAKAGDLPAILMPNPFYQAYGAAALAVGAEPVAVPATEATGFLPDYAALPPALLDRVTLAYVCSPSNPQGAVADADWWRALLDLAERHDFRILADECYSEIWRDTPPPGALETATKVRFDELSRLEASLRRTSRLESDRSRNADLLCPRRSSESLRSIFLSDRRSWATATVVWAPAPKSIAK